MKDYVVTFTLKPAVKIDQNMKLTFKEVLIISKHQRKGIKIWGNKLIDLTKYEKEVICKSNRITEQTLKLLSKRC